MSDHTTVSAYRKGVTPENISLGFTAEDGSRRARTDCPLAVSWQVKKKKAKVGRRITSKRQTGITPEHNMTENKESKMYLKKNIKLRAMW